jgi:hypothetical protein
MDTPTEPPPEAMLAALTGPIAAYRQALDDGVSFADTTMHGLPPCPWTWAQLTRYWAAVGMDRSSIGKPWTVTKMPNNGLEVRLNGWTFRPLKTIDAGPPSPGLSRTRRGYYSQFIQESLFSLESGGLNLLLDWSLDKNRTPVLALSKPSAPWKYKAQPRLEWRRIVTFPEDGGPTFAPKDSQEDIDILPVIDEAEFGSEDS